MVGQDELLYRSVPADCVITEPGGWRLSTESFNDRHMKPSVDRHAIVPDPASAKLQVTDGIVQLYAKEVRAVDKIPHNPTAPPDQQVMYRLDVVARPISADDPDGRRENPAHARIESDPEVEAKKRFYKIKEALTRIAEKHGFVIRPS